MGLWWIPPTLRGYRPSWVGADVVAALSLVAVALPSQLATAQLAKVPVVVGLYAFFAGSLLYALLGTDRHLSVGADSTIAPVLAVGVASVAAAGSTNYVTAMALTALLVGVLLVLVGVARLGWIAELLSTPVTTGVLAGIAIEIVLRQIPVLLGVGTGATTTFDAIRTTFDHLGQVNPWTLGVGIGVLAVIGVAQAISQRLPGPLLAVVLSILAVVALNLATHHGVAVIGTVHGESLRFQLPLSAWSDVTQLLPTVLTVAFLCIAQTAATIRVSKGTAAPSPSDFNRDLIGVGAGSIAAGLAGAFAVDASPPNTAVTTAAGSRSQLTNAMAAVVVLGCAFALTGPLANLPQVTLAATLMFLATKLLRFGELRAILHFARIEFLFAGVTLLVVAFVGIEQGVLVAMALSLADRTRRSFRPRDTELGREPGTDHWIPRDIGRKTEEVPGVVVYLAYAALWYGNADYVRSRIEGLVNRAPAAVHAVIIDANAIADIDYTALQTLRGLIAELAQRKIVVGIARASHLVHHDLKHGSVLNLLGVDHLYASVAEAVAALSPPHAKP